MYPVRPLPTSVYADPLFHWACVQFGKSGNFRLGFMPAIDGTAEWDFNWVGVSFWFGPWALFLGHVDPD